MECCHYIHCQRSNFYSHLFSEFYYLFSQLCLCLLQLVFLPTSFSKKSVWKLWFLSWLLNWLASIDLPTAQIYAYCQQWKKVSILLIFTTSNIILAQEQGNKKEILFVLKYLHGKWGNKLKSLETKNILYKILRAEDIYR